MTARTIIVLKSINPIVILSQPNKKTIEFIAGWTANQQIQNFIQSLRKTHNIPPEGLDIKLFVNKNLYEYPLFCNIFIQSSFDVIAYSFIERMGFDPSFIDQIKLLVFFNAIIDIEYFNGVISYPICFILGKKQIASQMYDYPVEVGAILIPYVISKNELEKWLDKNWSMINEQMNKNLTINPYILKAHKNQELAMEILELKDDKKLTFSAITTALANKYPENKHVFSEEYIKKIYYDYKQLWSQFGSSKLK